MMWDGSGMEEFFPKGESVLAVLKSYVRPAILYGSEAWYLRENEVRICKVEIDPWWEQCVEYS